MNTFKINNFFSFFNSSSFPDSLFLNEKFSYFFLFFCYYNITNLVSNNLVMKILQNSYIHNSYISHIFDTWIIERCEICVICSFIGSYFIHQHIYPCVKFVFNTWYSCVKCTKLWMNKFCMIFIINSSHVKFVMNAMPLLWKWSY